MRNRIIMAGMGLAATVTLVAGCGQQSTPHPSMASSTPIPAQPSLPPVPFNSSDTACRPALDTLDATRLSLCWSSARYELDQRGLTPLPWNDGTPFDLNRLHASHCDQDLSRTGASDEALRNCEHDVWEAVVDTHYGP